MRALSWAITCPERVEHCIVLASTPRLSAQNIGFNEVARRSIISDPAFHGGDYYPTTTVPRHGLSLERLFANITSPSDDDYAAKFFPVQRATASTCTFHLSATREKNIS